MTEENKQVKTENSADVKVIAKPKPVAVREVAYEINDPVFGKFEVLKSANAWWMDMIKVRALITAFKSGTIISGALIQANISQAQWVHFNKIHPEFSQIKVACEEYAEGGMVNQSLNSVREGISNPHVALKVLEKFHPKFKVDPKVEPIQPTQQTNIQINADSPKVQKLIVGILEAVQKRTESGGDGNSGVPADGNVEEASQG